MTFSLVKSTVTIVLLSLLLGSAVQVSGVRHIPKSPKTTTDVKHPDFLVTIEPKPTILIPGVGRFLLPPKCKKPFYPYNPVTGAPLTGTGQIPSYGGAQGGAGTRTQLPGGDDTLVPNPGYETPTPTVGAGSGGNGQVPPVPLP